MSRRRWGRDAAGFTLAELLVVIIIISILASLTLVGVSMAVTSSRVSNSEILIDQLKSNLDQYRVRWGDYPPTSMAEFRITMPNDTNNGAESLCACLASKERGGALYSAGPERYGNTDGDKAPRNLTNWFFGNNTLWEITDHFDRPLMYLHARDYAKATPAQSKIVMVTGQPAQTVKAVKVPKLGTFLNPDRHQILSAGPDGTFGTSDDIQR